MGDVMATFKVILTRCCYVRGVPYTPDAELDLLPAEVQPLLDCWRAELANADDMPALRKAYAEAFDEAQAATPIYGQSVEAAAQQLDDIAQQRRPKRPIGFHWSYNGGGDLPQS